MELIYPIVTQTARGRELYEPGGILKKPGDILENRLCADFLDLVAADQGESFYLGDIDPARPGMAIWHPSDAPHPPNGANPTF